MYNIVHRPPPGMVALHMLHILYTINHYAIEQSMVLYITEITQVTAILFNYITFVRRPRNTYEP